jgi:hypothetical protein
MLTRELIQAYVGPGGTVHLKGLELATTEVPTGSRVQEYVTGSSPVSGDLVIVRAPDAPGMREHLPDQLPLGSHLALLLDVEASALPVGRLLSALSGIGVQVVAAAALSSFRTPVTAVVGMRSDELVPPTPLLAHSLDPGKAADDDLVARLLGEHVLENLVFRARERALIGELASLRAEQTPAALAERAAKEAATVAAAQRELDRQKARIQQIQGSETYRLAQVMARGLRRVRHPLGGPRSHA